MIMKKENVSFEKAMLRLEEIVKQMENGEVNLDKSLELFEEGSGLIKYISNILDKTEQKITILSKGEGDAPVESEFAFKED